jgi:hypothetical protein
VEISHPSRSARPAQVSGCVVHHDRARLGDRDKSGPSCNSTCILSAFLAAGSLAVIATTIPVEEHSGARASVEGTTTVLLAERDPYAAEFAEYFLRTEGCAVRIVLDPAASSTAAHAKSRACLTAHRALSGGSAHIFRWYLNGLDHSAWVAPPAG